MDSSTTMVVAWVDSILLEYFLKDFIHSFIQLVSQSVSQREHESWEEGVWGREDLKQTPECGAWCKA